MTSVRVAEGALGVPDKCEGTIEVSLTSVRARAGLPDKREGDSGCARGYLTSVCEGVRETLTDVKG